MSYKLKNSSILKRYKNNKKLFSILCQIKDMFYDRLKPETRTKIEKLEQEIIEHDNNKVINKKGLRTINEEYFTKTKDMYRIINKQIITITTTWEDNNGKERRLVY